MKATWILLTVLPYVLATPLSIDINIEIDEIPSHPGPSSSGNSYISSIDTERGAPWGLARISHRLKLTISTFSKYVYDSSGGEDTEVYVLGSGVSIEHEDFEGRARWGVTTMSGTKDEDNDGRGTHAAGIIAGRKYGLAKKAKIVAIKVFDSNQIPGTADVERGIRWMISAHQERMLRNSGSKGSVAVLAFEPLSISESYVKALNSVTEAGIHLVLPSGDDHAEGCSYSTLSSDILILGSSTLSDELAYFTNYGTCIDAYAPGLNILSTWRGSSDATNVISGGVPAAAHGAGLIAYTLGLGAGGVSPADNKAAVLELATKNILTGLPDQAHNRLLNNGVPLYYNDVATLDLLNQQA